MGDALDDAMDYMEELEMDGYSAQEAQSVVESGHGPTDFSMTPHQLDTGIKERVKKYHESRLEACKFILKLNSEYMSSVVVTPFNTFQTALELLSAMPGYNSHNCHKVIALAELKLKGGRDAITSKKPSNRTSTASTPQEGTILWQS
jgi:hypothetical protein